MSTTPLSMDSLRINGQHHKYWADLAKVLTGDGVRMTETLVGASTVTLTVQDEDRNLLRSPLVSGRTHLTFDGAGFELAQVSRAGNTLTLTFEDLAVARLRRHKKPRKVGPNKLSRAQFVRNLIAEEKWIDVTIAPAVDSKVELARGTFDSDGHATADASTEREDTWSAGQRIMGEIGWRCWCRRSHVYLTPDKWLLARDGYEIRENRDGVDSITMDWDVGKPAATASFTARAGFRQLGPGSRVSLSGMGPGDGRWLVSEVTRSPFSYSVQVSLVRGQPTLPEPVPDKGDEGETGYRSDLVGDGTGAETSGVIERFVQAALAQNGKPYVWGAEGPGSFDCSGLTRFAAKRINRTLVHSAKGQYATLQGRGHAVSVPTGIATRGALLFARNPIGHVAISLGNGNTIEAMGKSYGVCIGKTAGRFRYAATLM